MLISTGSNGCARTAFFRGTNGGKDINACFKQCIVPSNGEPSIVPSQDIVLGLYYTTREKINALGEGRIFSNVDEVERAYLNNTLELGTKIVVRIKETSLNEGGENNVEHLRRYETTTGRAMLSKILPPGLSFEELNKVLKKKEISKLINSSYRNVGCVHI